MSENDAARLAAAAGSVARGLDEGGAKGDGAAGQEGDQATLAAVGGAGGGGGGVGLDGAAAGGGYRRVCGDDGDDPAVPVRQGHVGVDGIGGHGVIVGPGRWRRRIAGDGDLLVRQDVDPARPPVPPDRPTSALTWPWWPLVASIRIVVPDQISTHAVDWRACRAGWERCRGWAVEWRDYCP